MLVRIYPGIELLGVAKSNWPSMVLAVFVDHPRRESPHAGDHAG